LDRRYYRRIILTNTTYFFVTATDLQLLKLA